jgi:hypothetical protein
VTERAAAPFDVLQHSTRVFKCGCQLVLDAAGRGEWAPCAGGCFGAVDLARRASLALGLVVPSAFPGK